MKIEITKIKLQLKDRAIELTADEARAVQAELNKLFTAEKSALDKFKEQYAKDIEAIKNRPMPCIPYPVHPQPIVIDRGPWWPEPWRVWCGDAPTPLTQGPWCGGVVGSVLGGTGCDNSTPSGTLLCINVG